MHTVTNDLEMNLDTFVYIGTDTCGFKICMCTWYNVL
jgi:hypothetical protein